MKLILPFLHEFLLPALIYTVFTALLIGPRLRRALKKLILASLLFLAAAVTLELTDLRSYTSYLACLYLSLLWTLCALCLFIIYLNKGQARGGTDNLESLNPERAGILLMLLWLADLLLAAGGRGFNRPLIFCAFGLALLVLLAPVLLEKIHSRSRNTGEDEYRSQLDPGLRSSALLLLYAAYAWHVSAFMAADSVLILAALLLGALCLALALAGPYNAGILLRALALSVCATGVGDLLVSVRDSGSAARLESVYEMRWLLGCLLALGIIFFFVLRARMASQAAAPAAARPATSLKKRLPPLLAAILCGLAVTWLLFPPFVLQLTAEHAGPEALARVLRAKGQNYINRHGSMSGEYAGELRAGALRGGRLPAQYQADYVSKVFRLRFQAVLLLDALMEKDRDGRGLDILAAGANFYCLQGRGFNHIAYEGQLACEALEVAFARRDVAYAARLAEAVKHHPDSVDLGFLMTYDETAKPGASFTPGETTWERLDFFKQAGFRLDVERQMGEINSDAIMKRPALPRIEAMLRAGLAAGDFAREQLALDSGHILFNSLPEADEEKMRWLRLFLENGLDPNIKNRGGRPLLKQFMFELRFMDRSYDPIRLLLEAGADPLHTDENNDSPYKFALHESDNGRGLRSILSWALQDQWPQTEAEKAAARRRLGELGLDRVPDSGKTPLAELYHEREYRKTQVNMFRSLGYTE